MSTGGWWWAQLDADYAHCPAVGWINHWFRALRLKKKRRWQNSFAGDNELQGKLLRRFTFIRKTITFAPCVINEHEFVSMTLAAITAARTHTQESEAVQVIRVPEMSNDELLVSNPRHSPYMLIIPIHRVVSDSSSTVSRVWIWNANCVSRDHLVHGVFNLPHLLVNLHFSSISILQGVSLWVQTGHSLVMSAV